MDLKPVIQHLFLLIFISILFIYCASNNSHKNLNKEPFNLNLNIKQLRNNTYSLKADLKLRDEAYIYSPFSPDTIYLHYEHNIEKNKFIHWHNNLTERPKAVKMFDSIIQQDILIMNSNCSYIQDFSTITNDDFVYNGIIRFLVEPSCVPYEIQYQIINKNNKLSIKKISTGTSADYKGPSIKPFRRIE